jgi:hypothetical protein
MTATTLPSAAPASYAALYGFIVTLAAAQTPPVYVVQADLEQFEPASYIVVEGVFDDEYTIEATGYTFIESFNIEGYCTTFTGSGPTEGDGTVPGDIMAQVYATMTNVVMAAVVTNRGGNGIPVLGITSYPHPFEVKAHIGNYTHSPGFQGESQAGWQGTLRWSFEFRSLVSPI